MARILCALSGGVDSSVAAKLLLDQGHEVVAVFMRNGIGGQEAREKSCCSASDARDASRVADRLGLAYYAVDYAEEFGSLIDGFVEAYRKGRTPSPCVLCNQDLKFGHLFELADSIGAEAVATGHYARLAQGALRRPRDRAKDQSYFLWGLPREQLDRIRFPLGDLHKEEVRGLAEEAGLSTAQKPESMEICFVPSNDYRDLLRERGGLTPGRFVDRQGRDLGGHEGYEGFTVGQRRGLPALGHPAYVLEIRPERAEVVLGRRDALGTDRTLVEGCRWLVEAPLPGSEIEVRAQIRARHEAAPARLRSLGEGRVELHFETPVEAATPGQAAAFYEEDRLLGGGWIGFPSTPLHSAITDS